MGLDAESQDLTARIRARRQAGIREGTIEPARPGEHGLAVGRAVPAPAPMPVRGAGVKREVVPFDDDPRPGGSMADEDISPPTDDDQEPEAETPEAPGVERNEFGEVVDPDYDPSSEFDLEFREADLTPDTPVRDLPEPTSTRKRASNADVANAVDAVNIRLLSVLDMLASIAAGVQVDAQTDAALAERLDAIEKYLEQLDVPLNGMVERLVGIEGGMVVLAQAIRELREAEVIAQVEPVEGVGLIRRFFRWLW